MISVENRIKNRTAVGGMFYNPKPSQLITKKAPSTVSFMEIYFVGSLSAILYPCPVTPRRTRMHLNTSPNSALVSVWSQNATSTVN